MVVAIDTTRASIGGLVVGVKRQRLAGDVTEWLAEDEMIVGRGFHL
jgi:hypothetical protein